MDVEAPIGGLAPPSSFLPGPTPALSPKPTCLLVPVRAALPMVLGHETRWMLFTPGARGRGSPILSHQGHP